MTDNYLGEFEQVVLLALLHLGGDQAYGVAIQQAIMERTKREPAIGSVYTTLTRLEAKGLVESRLGEPTPERGGRRKKYFTVLPAGKRAIRASVALLRSMARGLDESWVV